MERTQRASMLSVFTSMLVVALARESWMVTHVAIWTIESLILRLLSIKLEDSLDPCHILLLIRL